MAAKHDQMRNTNTLLVLDHIRVNGDSTRRDIQHATGLSWAAVSNISSELIERNVLYELPPQTKFAGRNPGSLDFIPKRNLTIGLELNAEGLAVLLFDLRCSIVDSLIEPLRSTERDRVISQMLSAVDRVIKRNSLKCADLLGIGIAMQGSVDSQGTTSLYNSFFLDWRNVPLKQICEDHFHIPAHVMHDPVCIALSEQWNRKLGPEDDFALIRLSYGIGMCYIAHGYPITGSQGGAGEFGHMVVNPQGPPCSCGNSGCLECYSSIRGLAHRILEAHQRGELSLPANLVHVDDRDVVGMKSLLAWGAKEAQTGHPVINRLFCEMGQYLGAGLANIVSLFNPKYLILTGELLEYTELFWVQAEAKARESAWSFSDYQILFSAGGREGAAKGAALHYINSAFESMTSPLLAQSTPA